MPAGPPAMLLIISRHIAARHDLVTVLGEFMPKLVKMAQSGERTED